MAGTCEEKIKKAPMQSKTGILPTEQEYLLAAATCLLTLMALIGSAYLIQKLIKKRQRCGIQFVIYISILIGNALMALTTMPMSVYIILAYRVPLSKDRDVFNNVSAIDMGPGEAVFCNISGYIFNVTRSTTLWSVCFFTFDRFLYVCFPFVANRVVKYWHYITVAVLIWTYFISFSASPYMFSQKYRHLSFEGLTCTWIIMDIIPDSLLPKEEIPYNVLLPYSLALNYIPSFLPLLFISVFTVAVVIELGKIHRKGNLSRSMISSKRQEESTGSRTLYGKVMDYLHGNREVKLSIIMLLTTVGFIVCYALWIYLYFLHLGMLLCIVDFSVLYVHDGASTDATLLIKLFHVHELVGFAHAAIEPLILYMVLAKPPKGKKNKQSISLGTSQKQCSQKQCSRVASTHGEFSRDESKNRFLV